MEKLLLRPIEVAEVLGLGRSKVYELIGNWTIPAIKIGSSVRVPATALQEWVLSKAIEPVSDGSRGSGMTAAAMDYAARGKKLKPH